MTRARSTTGERTARPRLWLLWLWCCACWPSALLAAPAITLELTRASGFNYPLDPVFDHRFDPGGRMTLEEVRAATDFVQPEDAPVAFGFRTGALWLRGVLHNRDNPAADWMLVFDSPVLDHIDVWLEDLRTTGPQTLKHFPLGDQLPYGQRTLDLRQLNTALNLPQGSSWRLWIRIESTSALRVRAQLVSRAEAHLRNAHELFGLGLYYGIVLALVVYTGVLWVTLRESSFILYVAHALSFAFLMLVLNGCAFQLWPNQPYWNNPAQIIALPAALICLLLFARSVLALPVRAPWLDRAFLALAVLTLPTGVVGVFLPDWPWIGWQNVLAVVGVLLIGVSALWLLLRQHADVLGFLVAWSLLLLGSWTAPSVSFGWIEQNFWTTWGVQIGSAMELIAMAFYLAHRISSLRSRDQRAIIEASELLERKVDDRTRELRDALARLDLAHQHLKELSQRDGLTGLYDRRRLDLLIEQRYAECAGAGLPLSLLMVDLDGFKQVNDQYGHRVGDDCLRALAARLRVAFAGPAEAIGRYGGEEFTVLLPGASLAVAYARAEAFRAEVEAMAVSTESGPVAIRLSIGLACADPAGSTTSAALLKRADAALYAAKRQGRNRVSTA
jgi:two-component system, sensor histidine kinase LadS